MLLWQVGSRSEQVPRNECDIPIYVARVDGREGGQQLHDDLYGLLRFYGRRIDLCVPG